MADPDGLYPAVVELENAQQCFIRLLTAMYADAPSGALGAVAHGEINNFVRAERAALDKTLNALHFDAVGMDDTSNMTYPARSTPERFRERIFGPNRKDKLAWLSSQTADVVDLLAHSIREGSPIRRISELYRRAAHFSNIVAQNTADRYTIMPGLFSMSSAGITIGASPTWPGFRIDGGQAEADGIQLLHGHFVDFVFENTGSSVAVDLANLHNEVVNLIREVARIKGWSSGEVVTVIIGLI